MKIFLIVLVVVLISVTALQAYITMAANKTSNQPYTVIRTEKTFEIRFYPAATMAKITSSASSYKELGSSGFRKLAGYIFGGNEGNQQIAMTAPVHMDINDSASSMSFVMPPNYNTTNLPKPKDASVALVTTEAEYVAAITFGGYASDTAIATHIALLTDALKAAGISYYGNFRFLGYNAPYQFFGRKNDVIVSVNWEQR